MKTINFETYAYDAIRESIKSIEISTERSKTIIEYYGDGTECTFEDYFDSQIKDGNLYDATDVFDEENLIGSLEDNIFEVEFEDAREKAFKEWFIEFVEEIDEEDLIDVSDDVEITPEHDSDDEGDDYISFNSIEYKGKSFDMIDREFNTDGDSFFVTVFRFMGEYGTQNVRKAAIIAGAKYVYVNADEDDYSIYFWK